MDKLIHFTASWCEPCKMMKPIIEEIVEENNQIIYVPVDIDSDRDTAIEYNVQGVPTFILERSDGSSTRVSGAMTKGSFVEALGL